MPEAVAELDSVGEIGAEDAEGASAVDGTASFSGGLLPEGLPVGALVGVLMGAVAAGADPPVAEGPATAEEAPAALEEASAAGVWTVGAL